LRPSTKPICTLAEIQTFNPLCIETIENRSLWPDGTISFQSSLHWDDRQEFLVSKDLAIFQSSLHWDFTKVLIGILSFSISVTFNPLCIETSRRGSCERHRSLAFNPLCIETWGHKRGEEMVRRNFQSSLHWDFHSNDWCRSHSCNLSILFALRHFDRDAGSKMVLILSILFALRHFDGDAGSKMVLILSILFALRLRSISFIYVNSILVSFNPLCIETWQKELG